MFCVFIFFPWQTNKLLVLICIWVLLVCHEHMLACCSIYYKGNVAHQGLRQKYNLWMHNYCLSSAVVHIAWCQVKREKKKPHTCIRSYSTFSIFFQNCLCIIFTLKTQLRTFAVWPVGLFYLFIALKHHLSCSVINQISNLWNMRIKKIVDSWKHAIFLLNDSLGSFLQFKKGVPFFIKHKRPKLNIVLQNWVVT